MEPGQFVSYLAAAVHKVVLEQGELEVDYERVQAEVAARGASGKPAVLHIDATGDKLIFRFITVNEGTGEISTSAETTH